jgi:anti-sigma regulatory factor (Ser/Thr protein kinase)
MRERASEHEATLASDPLQLREARRRLTRQVLEAGCGPGDAQDLAVAFSEACANVHRHAYGGRRDGRIGLQVVIDGERIVLTLEHDGKPFDPATYRPPDLDRPAESGYGLYLVAALVDETSFEPTPTGGRIVLIKRRQGSNPHV